MHGAFPLRFGNDEIIRTTEHKHHGIILNSKLSFKSHVIEAVFKATREIGLVRYLSQYVSRSIFC